MKSLANNPVERAARRRAGVVRLELLRGLHRLAVVPATVVGAGAWGTAGEILNAFKVCGVSENSLYEAAVAGGLAEAFMLFALGLLIGLAAWVGHRALRAQADVLTQEMNIACYDLARMLKPPVHPTPRCLAVDAAERASARRAAVLRIEQTRGLGHLAAIPITVLFAGFLGTAAETAGMFTGCPCPSPWSDYAAMIYLTAAGALHWLLWGLAIAISVGLIHRYLRGQAERLNDDMAIACNDLTNSLHRFNR